MSGDKDAVDQIQELVARGAGDWPFGPQVLIRQQDLLDRDVEAFQVVLRPFGSAQDRLRRRIRLLLRRLESRILRFAQDDRNRASIVDAP